MTVPLSGTVRSSISGIPTKVEAQIFFILLRQDPLIEITFACTSLWNSNHILSSSKSSVEFSNMT